MAASWDSPLPTLMLSLLLLRACSPLHTPGPVSDRGGTLPPPDYYESEDGTSGPPEVTSPDRGVLRRCDYSPCLENQPSCEELAASTRCLCPGFTLHSEAPQAPLVRSVRWNGSEVVLRWCAPHSYVTAYEVTVGGSVRGRFGTERRSGSVGSIQERADVCVVAVNEAGHSEGSCAEFWPQGGGRPLTAGLVGGALGLLLLVLLGALVCRHRKQRKREVSVPSPESV